VKCAPFFSSFTSALSVAIVLSRSTTAASVASNCRSNSSFHFARCLPFANSIPAMASQIESSCHLLSLQQRQRVPGRTHLASLRPLTVLTGPVARNSFHVKTALLHGISSLHTCLSSVARVTSMLFVCSACHAKGSTISFAK
jgi:hypothetical protein